MTNIAFAQSLKMNKADSTFVLNMHMYSGTGVEVPIQMNMKADALFYIVSGDLYYNWKTVHKVDQSLESSAEFLQAQVNNLGQQVSDKLIRPISFRPITGSKGIMYHNEDCFIVGFFFEAQNELGNYIVFKVIVVINKDTLENPQIYIE